MHVYLAIALGSALGGVLRHWIGSAIQAAAGRDFPVGTLFVNVTGALLIGCVAGRVETPPAWSQFLMVGILGGYTTFSAFSLQTLQLFQQGRVLPACGYVAASVALCLLGTWLGQTIVRFAARP